MQRSVQLFHLWICRVAHRMGKFRESRPSSESTPPILCCASCWEQKTITQLCPLSVFEVWLEKRRTCWYPCHSYYHQVYPLALAELVLFNMALPDIPTVRSPTPRPLPPPPNVVAVSVLVRDVLHDVFGTRLVGVCLLALYLVCLDQAVQQFVLWLAKETPLARLSPIKALLEEGGFGDWEEWVGEGVGNGGGVGGMNGVPMMQAFA